MICNNQRASGGAARLGKASVARGALAGMTMATAMLAMSGTPALAKAAAPSYSEKFIAAAQPTEAALQKAQGKPLDAAGQAALKKLIDAEDAVTVSGDEKLLAGQDLYQFSLLTQDQALQRQGAQMMLDSGKAPPELQPKLELMLGELAFQAKDYAATVPLLKAATQAGLGRIDDYAMIAVSLGSLNQTADAVAAWNAAIAKAAADGTKAPEEYYASAFDVAYNAQMKDQAVQGVTALVAAYPSAKNWTNAVAATANLYDYKKPERLDAERLLVQADAVRHPSIVSDFVRAADPRALPGEVKAVMDKAAADGIITVTSPEFAPSYTLATNAIAADKRLLLTSRKLLTTPGASADDLRGAGDAYLEYAQYADALTFYQAALAKSSVEADLINTRIGIAQVGLGQYADAQATFAKVGGIRAPIAKLWTIFAQQKTATPK